MATIRPILLLLLLAWAASAQAEEIEVPYKIVDGKLHVFGHVLQAKEPIPKTSTEEKSYSVIFDRSPSGRWILSGIATPFYYDNTVLWLYDSKRKDAPRRLTGKRLAKHLGKINWHSNTILSITWAGFLDDFLFTEFHSTDDAGFRLILSDMLHYDAERDVYVRIASGMENPATIEVGCVACKGVSPESYKLLLRRPKKAIWVRFRLIDEVRVEGDTVILRHHALHFGGKEGEPRVERYRPKFLRGRK